MAPIKFPKGLHWETPKALLEREGGGPIRGGWGWASKKETDKHKQFGLDGAWA